LNLSSEKLVFTKFAFFKSVALYRYDAVLYPVPRPPLRRVSTRPDGRVTAEVGLYTS
jgi:hypothetical protein